MQLSVAVITKNEEKNIKDCLESVKWADEIIIVDSNSTDQTLEICKEYTSKIYNHDWEGFGIQKNRAIQYCQYPWVLSLDADERITPELAKEIKNILIQKKSLTGYAISRKSFYCTKLIKYSGWSPDFVLRLFKKKYGYFNNNLVHESLTLKGNYGYLKNHIIHYTYDNFETIIQKMNLYSSEKAQMMYEKKYRSSLSKSVLKGMFTFFRTYIFKLGFLDGKEGLMLAISNAEICYYSYIKLWLLNKK